MRRVLATIEDSVAVHKAVVDQKQGALRTRLTNINSQVEVRINDLLLLGPFGLATNDLGHVCHPGFHHPCLRRDLNHCWDSSTSVLNELKQRLVDELGYFPCPYCGIGEADTFDHYLPRKYFPEFSATAANLIPCCSRCNLLKKAHRATIQERILHPVIDPLDHRLFKCTIDDVSGTPTATFEVDDAIAGAFGLTDVCQFHFDRLDLANRFRRVTAPSLSAFLGSLTSLGVAWGPDGAEAARRLVQGMGAASMPNKWDVMLYEAVADWMDGL